MITKERIAELEKVCSDIIAKLSVANEDLNNAKNQYAVQVCPLKVGDRVKAVGWSHRGKEMLIEQINYPRYSFDQDWQVSGRLYKKNGELGLNTTSFSEYDWNKAAEAAK